MSVKRCQEEIDSREFAEWIAYNNRYPFIIDRSEYAAAIQTALLANIHSKKKFNPEDFLITPKRKEKQSPLMMQKILESMYGNNQ